jgi:hypothetical protein
MNVKTPEKALILFLFLAMAAMASCDLAAPAVVDTGSFVEVTMGGASMGARGIGADALWVDIIVVDSSGNLRGSGHLDKTGGVWKGKIHVDQSGQMTFTAIAGSAAGEVRWIGRNTYNAGVESGVLTIIVGSPAVATNPDNGYGPAGGKIFYDKGSYSEGWRYLEAAPKDQSAGVAWSNIVSPMIGLNAQGGDIGTGRSNTTAIVGQTGCLSGAAFLCDNLVIVYSDWFLPSWNELLELFTVENTFGEFMNGDSYWTSSELDENSIPGYGEAILFPDFVYALSKDADSYVRAIRAF